MKRWLGVACLGLVTAPVLAQCSPDAAAKAAALVHQRQAELLKIKTDELTTEVPVAAWTAIAELKDALSDVVEASLHCANKTEAADVLQLRLAKLLGANLPEKARPEPSNQQVEASYGGYLKVKVSAPENAASMRAIEASFGIECGDDTMLLMYESTPQGWRRLMRWQSPSYKEISGAFGDFFVNTVIPGEAPDGLRVVVAHGTPWCTSRFSGFKIDVLAPDHGNARVVWHTGRGYSRGDFATRLRATDDGFELRLNAPAMDISGYERTVIYRYQVAGDQVTRIPPIATNGRGFVEEWMAMPWDEAQGQTAPEALVALKAIHERLERADKEEKTYISYEYGPVRACSVKGRYEVEMDADPGGPQFFAIQEGPKGYAMVNFGTTQDERCSGPDVMKKR